MNDTQTKKFMSILIFVVLLTLSFLILKPILLSVIVGIILAFILSPAYNFFYNLTLKKSKDLPALIICLLLIVLILIPFWFLTPVFIEQSLRFYVAAQQTDFITPLKELFPSLFNSADFSAEIGSIIKKFVTNSADSAINSLANIVFNLPAISLQIMVVLFTFYFVLRDKEELVKYIKSLLPFSKEVENKFFEYSKGITYSVIYGQVIIGIIQGIIVGIGFFLFGVPNALFLTLVASLAGILPIIGTVVVWLPVVIFLVIADNTGSAFGVIIFGVISSSIDNLLRPIIVSRTIKIHSGIVLIGMIGGLFFFGVLGFILGPLILSYLLIILELYKNKGAPDIFFQQEPVQPTQ